MDTDIIHMIYGLDIDWDEIVSSAGDAYYDWLVSVGHSEEEAEKFTLMYVSALDEQRQISEGIWNN